MEVARLVVTAIEFVDQAIQNGTVIARVFKNTNHAGEKELSAVQRLEAQRYTLELWQRIWDAKAAARHRDTLEEGFQDIWGDKGYKITIKCLAQLNVKFGEAFRTIRSIDPDTFADIESDLDQITQHIPVSTDSLTNEASSGATKTNLTQEHSIGTSSQVSLQNTKKERLLRRWLKRLSTKGSVPFWKRKSLSSLAPSASRIRAVAKVLYTASQKIPSGHDLDFKLEKERADSAYFERYFGRVEYVDQTDCSFKFPLNISNDGDERMLLLAEAIYSGGSLAPNLLAKKVNTLEEIVAIIKDRVASAEDLPPSFLFQNHHRMIVINGITRSSKSSPDAAQAISKCSFADLLKAQTGVDQFIAGWKRLQLACIIAISVLHLYETGWISEQLETNDFHFFGSAESQYHEINNIAPYVSSITSRTDLSIKFSPFDCLKKNQLPDSLLGTRDVRLATLFHRLGIVLFELGRGLQYTDVFDEGMPTKSEVLSQIEEIPFGRPYRDLVKTCLTGSLYAASVVNIDTHFNHEVIEK